MSYCPTLFTCSKCPILSFPSFYALKRSVLLSYFLQFATCKCFTFLLFYIFQVSYCSSFYTFQGSVLLSYFLNQRKRPVLWFHLCMFGCSDLTNWSRKPLNRFFWNLAWSWGTIRVKNSTARFLIKFLILADFGQTCQKMAKITVFGTLRKNYSNKFSEIALKVSPKIVL